MKRKRLLLFLIVLFPSTFWLILEMSTVNSKKLPYYGPKSFDGKDSVYYTVDSPALLDAKGAPAFDLDTNRFPIYVIGFLKPEYAKEKFRLEGLLGYANYKEQNIEHIPIVLAGAISDSVIPYNYRDTLAMKNKNIYQAYVKAADFEATNQRFFKEKPYYVDYSFLVLVDKKRHIRGYYDGRYVSELKRLLEEYKHMRLKEEHQLIQKENKIEKLDKK